MEQVELDSARELAEVLEQIELAKARVRLAALDEFGHLELTLAARALRALESRYATALGAVKTDAGDTEPVTRRSW